MELDGRRAIVRADPGRYSLRRIDRDREIRPVHFPILHHHALQPELLGALARDRDANEPAPVHRHEVDRRRRRLLRGHDEIALVFPVRVIGHNDHFSCRNVVEDFVDRVELKGFRCLDDHAVTIAVAPLLGNGISLPARCHDQEAALFLRPRKKAKGA